MKILSSYKKIAKEFIKEAAWDRKFGEPLPTLEDVMKETEVDDDKIIKYKDKEGESQEMTAGAAKKQPDEHPAKVVYNKMKDGGGDGEKDSSGKLGGSDFSRDGGDDEPKGEPESDDEPKKLSPVGNGAKIDDMIAKATKDAGLDDWQRVSDNSKEVDNFSSWEEYESHLKDVAEKQKQRDEPKGDEEPKKISSDEIDKKVQDLGDEIRNIYQSGMSPQDSERYIDGLQKQIDDLKSQKESIKVIDGKKYKAIKESKKNPQLFKEIYDRTFRSLK